MKISLVWNSPSPEKTIAIAMRRCYSTKPIEEIEAELDQKGTEYWKYLLMKALQDKSLDVVEHFTMTLAVDGASEQDVGRVARDFPFVRFLRLGDSSSWLLTMNARTLIEMHRTSPPVTLAGEVVAELDRKKVCPVLSSVAFGGGTAAG